VRAGHAGIGDEAGSFREDGRVGRLYMRVRAHDRGDATVEPSRHRGLLAGCFGMHVHENHRRLAPRLLDELVD